MRLIDRAVRVLTALAESDGDGGVGVTKLAEQIGESPSSVHRLLSALSAHALVVQGDDKRYRVGSGVLKFANSFQRQNPLVTTSRTSLARLTEITGESVFLAQLIDDEVICTATAESSRRLTLFMRLGQRTPFHAAASARAIAAYQSPESIERLLGRERLTPFTGKTVRTMSDALQRLDETRQRGYSVCDGEIEVGVSAIGVPIFDNAGSCIASLTLVAPSHRLEGDPRDKVVTELQREGETISETLGYTGSYPMPDIGSSRLQSHERRAQSPRT